MKISACWITKNEEKNIIKSIDSLKSIVDDMLVVDTGSSDKTVEVVQQAGARVLPFQWVDDFSAARNFALEQIDADVIIFLDADQWFEPALESIHRKTIETQFLPSAYDGMVSNEDNIDPVTGIHILNSEKLAIFKGKGHMRYFGSIHERLGRVDGKPNLLVQTDDFDIKHTGYGTMVGEGKAERNLRLLLKSVETNKEDNADKALDMTYILREASILKDYTKAADALAWLMNEPKWIKSVHSRFFDAGVVITTWGLTAASKVQPFFSRRQLRDVLVTPLKTYSGEYINTVVHEMTWNRHFRIVESELLQLASAIPGQNEDVLGDEYLTMKEAAFRAAAVAKERRNDKAGMFQYASKALTQDANSLIKETFATFFRAVRGLPDSDIIKFMDTLVKKDNKGTMDKLVSGSQFVGFKMVFLYYAMKEYKMGALDAVNYCFMLLASGKYAETLKFLQEKTSYAEKETQQAYFLAVICSQNAQYCEEYQAGLGAYAGLARAYFNGYAGEDFSAQLDILDYAFRRTAFLHSFEAANRLLNLFENAKDQCFDVQSAYYMDCGMYREFLAVNTYQPAETDEPRLLTLADIYVRAGAHEEAFNILSRMVFRESFSYMLFNLLDVVIEMTEGELRDNARSLYDKYFDSYDAYVDYNDIVRTGYIAEHDSQKQKKALARMQAGEFDRWLKDEKPFTAKSYMPTCFEAAGVLRENGSSFTAFECYFKLLAAGWETEKVRAALADLFRQAGNGALAAHLAN